eukprot:jgi/Bigna1/85845/estExt_fgenesh1_pg.C_60248
MDSLERRRLCFFILGSAASKDGAHFLLGVMTVRRTKLHTGDFHEIMSASKSRPNNEEIQDSLSALSRESSIARTLLFPTRPSGSLDPELEFKGVSKRQGKCLGVPPPVEGNLDIEMGVRGKDEDDGWIRYFDDRSGLFYYAKVRWEKPEEDWVDHKDVPREENLAIGTPVFGADSQPMQRLQSGSGSKTCTPLSCRCMLIGVVAVVVVGMLLFNTLALNTIVYKWREHGFFENLDKDGNVPAPSQKTNSRKKQPLIFATWTILLNRPASNSITLQNLLPSPTTRHLLLPPRLPSQEKEKAPEQWLRRQYPNAGM